MAYHKDRAVELGTLIDAAYAHFNGAATWQPAGYKIETIFTALEPWKTGPQSVPFSIPQVSTILSGVQLPHLGLPQLPQFTLPQFTLPQIPTAIPHQVAPVPFGFVATKGQDAYVVIRGTMTPLEWFADFTIIPTPFAMNSAWGQTTQGFKIISDQIRTAIIEHLKPLLASHQITQVYVTGHSLGAALAHLIAVEIFENLKVNPISYTFSGPRTGDHAFALAYAKAGLETWRIFNSEDIVPTLPLAAVELLPQKIGLTNNSPMETVLQTLVRFMPSGVFQHVGTPMAITFHKGNIADNHNLTNTYQSLP